MSPNSHKDADWDYASRGGGFALDFVHWDVAACTMGFTEFMTPTVTSTPDSCTPAHAVIFSHFVCEPHGFALNLDPSGFLFALHHHKGSSKFNFSVFVVVKLRVTVTFMVIY